MNEAWLVGAIAAIGPIGAIAYLGWWMRDRFADGQNFSRDLMERHEAKDVERFRSVTDQIHDIELAAALARGEPAHVRHGR